MPSNPEKFKAASACARTTGLAPFAGLVNAVLRAYVERHESELVTRIGYWAGVSPGVVRSLLRALRERADAMTLQVAGREATTLIELTAFGTAVLLHWRYARIADAHPPAHVT